MDDQIRHYEAKLQYEIDPWDLNELIGGLDCWRYDGYPVHGSEAVQPGSCGCS